MHEIVEKQIIAAFEIIAKSKRFCGWVQRSGGRCRFNSIEIEGHIVSLYEDNFFVTELNVEQLSAVSFMEWVNGSVEITFRGEEFAHFAVEIYE